MRILSGILGKSGQVGGELGFFGLGAWWSSEFSRAEQRYLEAAFILPDLPAGARPLTRQHGLLAIQTAAGLLTLLADRLGSRPEDRALACRVLAKAEERARAEDDVLGLHLTYHQMIRLHCRWKEHFADALDLAFAACHKQIRLASRAAEALRLRSPGAPLPTHLGYQQATSMLEQQGAYAQALEVCKQAQSEGWAGNWSWRIGRLAKRLHETSGSMKSISRSGIGPV